MENIQIYKKIVNVLFKYKNLFLNKIKLKILGCYKYQNIKLK